MFTKLHLEENLRRHGVTPCYIHYFEIMDDGNLWIQFSFTNKKALNPGYISDGEYDCIVGYYNNDKDNMWEAISFIKEKYCAELGSKN